MTRILRKLILLIACIFFAGNMTNAQSGWREPVGDSLQFELITCEPGEEVYELFGHTALRMLDKTSNADLVFNYGTFSFDEPNFLWRFILGEGSYFLEVLPYPFFAAHYSYEGRAITAQSLNLTAEQKLQLYHALAENLHPENIKYRYNFLYDNCTTRAVRQIENVADSMVYTLPESARGKTFRTIIHEATENAPWTQFGIDLLLGAEVDRPMTTELFFFSPLYAEALFETATAKDSTGTRSKFVISTETTMVPPHTERAETAVVPTPAKTLSILFILVLPLCLIAWRKQRTSTVLDVTLLLTQGAMGSVIALLFFFSEHPAVGSNWLIIWLNPLPFVGLLMRYVGKGRPLRRYYHPCAAIVLGFSLLAMPFFPQDFPLAAIPLTATFFIHALTTALIERKKQK